MPAVPPSALSPGVSLRLEPLRLFRVMQVVLGHYANIGLPPIPTLDLSRAADLFVALYRVATRFGPQAAVVFVCMSGFLLVPRLVAIGLKRPDQPTVRSFMQGRLRRIYPTLVAAVLLTLVLDLAGIHLLGAEPFYHRVNGYDAVKALALPAFVGNLLSLQPTFFGAFGTNGPLWTLGYIVQFYICGAALAAAMRANRRLAMGLLAGLLLIPFAYRPEWSLLFAFWLMCGFARWFPPRSARAGWIALALGLGLFIVANLVPGDPGAAAAGLAGVCFLMAVMAPLPAMGLYRLPRAIEWFNAQSYALYAMHFPIAVLGYACMVRWIDMATLPGRMAWPAIALALGLVVAAGWTTLLDRLLGKAHK